MSDTGSPWMVLFAYVSFAVGGVLVVGGCVYLILWAFCNKCLPCGRKSKEKDQVGVGHAKYMDRALSGTNTAPAHHEDTESLNYEGHTFLPRDATTEGDEKHKKAAGVTQVHVENEQLDQTRHRAEIDDHGSSIHHDVNDKSKLLRKEKRSSKRSSQNSRGNSQRLSSTDVVVAAGAATTAAAVAAGATTVIVSEASDKNSGYDEPQPIHSYEDRFHEGSHSEEINEIAERHADPEEGLLDSGVHNEAYETNVSNYNSGGAFDDAWQESVPDQHHVESATVAAVAASPNFMEEESRYDQRESTHVEESSELQGHEYQQHGLPADERSDLVGSISQNGDYDEGRTEQEFRGNDVDASGRNSVTDTTASIRDSIGQTSGHDVGEFRRTSYDDRNLEGEDADRSLFADKQSARDIDSVKEDYSRNSFVNAESYNEDHSQVPYGDQKVERGSMSLESAEGHHHDIENVVTSTGLLHSRHLSSARDSLNVEDQGHLNSNSYIENASLGDGESFRHSNLMVKDNDQRSLAQESFVVEEVAYNRDSILDLRNEDQTSMREDEQVDGERELLRQNSETGSQQVITRNSGTSQGGSERRSTARESFVMEERNSKQDSIIELHQGDYQENIEVASRSPEAVAEEIGPSHTNFEPMLLPEDDQRLLQQLNEIDQTDSMAGTENMARHTAEEVLVSSEDASDLHVSMPTEEMENTQSYASQEAVVMEDGYGQSDEGKIIYSDPDEEVNEHGRELLTAAAVAGPLVAITGNKIRKKKKGRTSLFGRKKEKEDTEEMEYNEQIVVPENIENLEAAAPIAVYSESKKEKKGKKLKKKKTEIDKSDDEVENVEEATDKKSKKAKKAKKEALIVSKDEPLVVEKEYKEKKKAKKDSKKKADDQVLQHEEAEYVETREDTVLAEAAPIIKESKKKKKEKKETVVINEDEPVVVEKEYKKKDKKKKGSDQLISDHEREYEEARHEIVAAEAVPIIMESKKKKKEKKETVIVNKDEKLVVEKEYKKKEKKKKEVFEDQHNEYVHTEEAVAIAAPAPIEAKKKKKEKKETVVINKDERKVFEKEYKKKEKKNMGKVEIVEKDVPDVVASGEREIVEVAAASTVYSQSKEKKSKKEKKKKNYVEMSGDEMEDIEKIGEIKKSKDKKGKKEAVIIKKDQALVIEKEYKKKEDKKKEWKKQKDEPDTYINEKEEAEHRGEMLLVETRKKEKTKEKKRSWFGFKKSKDKEKDEDKEMEAKDVLLPAGAATAGTAVVATVGALSYSNLGYEDAKIEETNGSEDYTHLQDWQKEAETAINEEFINETQKEASDITNVLPEKSGDRLLQKPSASTDVDSLIMAESPGPMARSSPLLYEEDKESSLYATNSMSYTRQVEDGTQREDEGYQTHDQDGDSSAQGTEVIQFDKDSSVEHHALIENDELSEHGTHDEAFHEERLAQYDTPYEQHQQVLQSEDHSFRDNNDNYQQEIHNRSSSELGQADQHAIIDNNELYQRELQDEQAKSIQDIQQTQHFGNYGSSEDVRQETSHFVEEPNQHLADDDMTVNKMEYGNMDQTDRLSDTLYDQSHGQDSVEDHIVPEEVGHVYHSGVLDKEDMSVSEDIESSQISVGETEHTYASDNMRSYQQSLSGNESTANEHDPEENIVGVIAAHSAMRSEDRDAGADEEDFSISKAILADIREKRGLKQPNIKDVSSEKNDDGTLFDELHTVLRSKKPDERESAEIAYNINEDTYGEKAKQANEHLEEEYDISAFNVKARASIFEKITEKTGEKVIPTFGGPVIAQSFLRMASRTTTEQSHPNFMTSQGGGEVGLDSHGSIKDRIRNYTDEASGQTDVIQRKDLHDEILQGSSTNLKAIKAGFEENAKQPVLEQSFHDKGLTDDAGSTTGSHIIYNAGRDEDLSDRGSPQDMPQSENKMELNDSYDEPIDAIDTRHHIQEMNGDVHGSMENGNIPSQMSSKRGSLISHSNDRGSQVINTSRPSSTVIDSSRYSASNGMPVMSDQQNVSEHVIAVGGGESDEQSHRASWQSRKDSLTERESLKLKPDLSFANEGNMVF